MKRMRDIHRGKKSGSLCVESSSTRRELFFRAGAIVGIRTSVDFERLGELLIGRGRITRQQFEDASIFVRHGWRLGQILAELKVISEAEIDKFVRMQAIEVACRALGEPRAKIGFHESAELFTTLATPLSATAVIMEASRRLDNVAALRKVVAAETRTFQPASTAELAACTDLTPEDGYLISRFQDGATLDAVLKASSFAEEPTLNALFGLVQSGLLVRENGPRSEDGAADPNAFRNDVDRMLRRLERQDPWRALGLPSDVGIETAHAAFRDAVRRYHPDRHHSCNDPELMNKLTRLCQAFTDAHTCLSTALRLRRARADESAVALASTAVPHAVPSSRTVPPVSRDTRTVAPISAVEVAEQNSSTFPDASAPASERARPAGDGSTYLREGKRALVEGDYWRAIQLLQHAKSLGEESFQTHFLLGEALSKNSRWRTDAEQSYRRALELEPWRRDVYAALAKLYENAGLTLRATKIMAEARDRGVGADLAGLSADSRDPSPALVVS